jgi:transcriptional regulator with XRE-family HTH domain
VNLSTLKRSLHATDRHVGNRVRMRRKMQGMSQQKLGEALGFTFQPVQKYEKGINRIGADRLRHIASIQQVPISFFFEGAPGLSDALDESSAYVSGFLATSDGLALTKATCTSKTPSSGGQLWLWLSSSPDKTNLNRSRCGSFDRGSRCRAYPLPPMPRRRTYHARRR